VSVRRHGKGDQGALTLAEAIATLKEESASRKQ